MPLIIDIAIVTTRMPPAIRNESIDIPKSCRIVSPRKSEIHKIMALRVFRLISDLKIAVEVGLVVGTMPQIIPMGSAIVMVPKMCIRDRNVRNSKLFFILCRQ